MPNKYSPSSMSMFDRFYELWIHNFQLLLRQLLSIPNKPKQAEHHHQLSTQLIKRVMTHYGDYSRVMTQTVQQDPLSIYVSSWFTSLERSLHWISGWRPTTIFHLVYTETSVRFEAHLIDFLHGRKIGDLGDLSQSQLGTISKLQCETVREENEITSELDYWQNSACDIVLMLAEGEPEIERLVSVLKRAEDLRLRTITKVVEILTPQQAIDFLIAAAELQFGVRGWGLGKDQRRG